MYYLLMRKVKNYGKVCVWEYSGSIFLSVLIVSENKMLFIPFAMASIPLSVLREVIPVFKQVSSC